MHSKQDQTNRWHLKQRVEVEDGTVAFDVFGEGPSVVLVHGTPSWSYLWRNVVPKLADRFTVYVFDLLGYGDSEPKGQDVSIAAQTRALTGLVGQWGPREPGYSGPRHRRRSRASQPPFGRGAVRPHCLDRRRCPKPPGSPRPPIMCRDIWTSTGRCRHTSTKEL